MTYTCNEMYVLFTWWKWARDKKGNETSGHVKHRWTNRVFIRVLWFSIWRRGDSTCMTDHSGTIYKKMHITSLTDSLNINRLKCRFALCYFCVMLPSLVCSARLRFIRTTTVAKQWHITLYIDKLCWSREHLTQCTAIGRQTKRTLRLV